MKTTARMLPVADAAEAANNHKTMVGTGYLTTGLTGSYLDPLGSTLTWR